MGHYVQILLLVITGVVLLWFGYTLFFGIGFGAASGNGFYRGKKGKKSGDNFNDWAEYSPFPDDPRTCPVCSSKLDDGLLVKSLAFPSLNGGQDRMMHIKGCVYCIRGERERLCPVCGRVLYENDVLVCRMFERRHGFRRRPHVHVLGCSRCRKV